MQAGQSSNRRWIPPLTAGLTLAAVAVLAIGVDRLELKPGVPMAFNALDTRTLSQVIGQIGAPDALLGFLGNLLRIGVLVALPFAVVHFIRSPEARKRVLTQLFYLLLFSLAVLSLSRTFHPPQIRPTALSPPESSLPGAPAAAGSIAAEAPRWLINAISLTGAAALAAAGYWIYRRSRQVPSDTRAAVEAQLALAEIEAGADLENVILRAYYQLCVASRSRRGIARSRNQTAREYGGDLRQAGLPPQALHQITRLFEKARYGDKPLDADDERAAVESLRQILRSLGEL